eukprot:scaffold1913_cov257-Pinguiococcus_pyrenoidosus.AAC.35
MDEWTQVRLDRRGAAADPATLSDISRPQAQLDVMKLGGNRNAREYFAQHGLMNLKTSKRYSSRVATHYKQHLQRLVSGASHEVRCPWRSAWPPLCL